MYNQKELIIEWNGHPITKKFIVLLKERKEYETGLLLSMQPIDAIECAKHIGAINFISNFLGDIDNLFTD